MSNPNLHVKDSYFFEVPHSWWQRDYQSISDVPEFMVDAHPQASLEEFNHALSGKILIPQVFGGELKNLYEAESGVCVSKFMILETLVAVGLVLGFVSLAKGVEGGKSVVGRLHNLLEAFVQYIRDEVVRPIIGEEDEDKFLPFLLTVFFFIFAANLLGMIPFMGTITGDLHITGVLAVCTFVLGTYWGIRKMGVAGFFANFIPHIDLHPIIGWPLKAMIFVIEIFGVLIKHAVLAIRLFANMVAGHLVLLGIALVLVNVAETASFNTWAFGAFFGVLGSAVFSCLELLVAALQAYVFTMLSAIFISMSVHHH